jgi:hypothetical protein
MDKVEQTIEFLKACGVEPEFVLLYSVIPSTTTLNLALNSRGRLH